MLDVAVAHDAITIGPHFSVSFQRTLRIPDDGGTYPLPPELGTFPVRLVEKYRDTYGMETWDQENCGRVYVHIVNSLAYREITGEAPPSTPVSARTYTQYGLPWFDLYDEGKGDLAPSETLVGVKSIKQIDKEKGLPPQQDDSTIEIASGQVAVLGKGKAVVKDGTW